MVTNTKKKYERPNMAVVELRQQSLLQVGSPSATMPDYTINPDSEE